MRKLTYLMLLLLGVCLAQADLVDDFESYALGTAASPWVTTETEMYAQIAADSGNQYITTWSNSGSGYRDVSRQLEPEADPISTLSTLYLRVYVADDTLVDFAFGLCGDAAGTTGGDGAGSEWYADYGPYFRLISNGTAGDGLYELSVRNGGSFVDDLAYLNVGQWYSFWLVIDPTSGSGVHDLYYAAEGDIPTLARAANAFRDAYSTPLQSFLIMTNGADAAALNVRVDDIFVSPGEDLSVPVNVKPYAPGFLEGAVSGDTIETTLLWKAGPDPDEVYAVNPNIVDQYVFISSGSASDPNLYYAGATAVDESSWALTDPDSEFTFTAALDATYSWAVVQAIDGYAHNGADNPLLVLNVSTLDDVDGDPNNIVGSTWTYESKKSIPSITAQPVDARVFATDPSASFTVTFTSLVNEVTATWYKDDVALTAGGDITIDTDPHASSTLTIATPELADEGKYYCVLSVDENTTDDDLQTATRLLVIKKTLAQFNFENNLNDSSANGAPSGTVKTVSLEDPNEVLATVVGSPTYITGIEGSALYLDGTQFVDLGIEGYPKAGPLDTFGDARGEGYEKQGFGRGMEQGSILCWVKATSTGAVYMNANGEDNTHFGLTTGNENDARMIMRGSNWDGSYQELGAAAGGLQKDAFSLQDGYWHMFAATWDDSGMRTYINGEQVASSSAGVPEIYTAWERSNLVGASRTAGTRQILNSLLTGAVDSLRIYNYVISADDIAAEYLTKNEQGYAPCADQNFVGNEYNFDNSGSSYCKVDLADFAVFAQHWLENGLYDLP